MTGESVSFKSLGYIMFVLIDVTSLIAEISGPTSLSVHLNLKRKTKF